MITNKESLEREHAEKMNLETVERMKEEAKSPSKVEKLPPDQVASIFFEDDKEIMLRDGNVYKLTPCTLKKARRLMSLLKSVNIDVVMLNYLPSEDPDEDKRKQEELMEILMLAFSGYPEVTSGYLEEYVDFVSAKKIIEIVIGLNGIVKE